MIQRPIVFGMFPLMVAVACAGPNAVQATQDNQPVAEETSVKPGINQNFLSPDLDVGSYVERFEGDNREVFVHRARIASAADVKPGMRIADVGAGTGLFMRMFAPRVGDAGKVYAVEISEKFVDHLQQDIRSRGLANVETILCTERSVELPTASVDLAFVCDTYHHFEYPMSTLASIHDALRPGGELVIVDFDRIPGVSREWLLDHVRCGKEVVIEEVESAGFELVRQEASPFLRENYILRFRRS